MTKYLTTIYILLSFSLSFAQVGIGTTKPDESSILDITSTDKGFLLPRVNLLSDKDITTITTPAQGLMVYNMSSCNLQKGVYIFNGTLWERVSFANEFSVSRLVKGIIKVDNVTFTPINAVRTYANYSSLFNGSDDTGANSFHMERNTGTTDDWGFGMTLDKPRVISELSLNGRNDGGFASRVGNVLVRLYLCGNEVFSSSKNITPWVQSNTFTLPNVYADEIRILVPNGENTSYGDGVMNFSELAVKGY